MGSIARDADTQPLPFPIALIGTVAAIWLLGFLDQHT